jgi:hypothetical protein
MPVPAPADAGRLTYAAAGITAVIATPRRKGSATVFAITARLIETVSRQMPV